MLEFYETLLNLRKWNPKDVIIILNRVISEEANKVNNYIDSYEGLCKVFSNNLYIELTKLGFRVNKINISDIYKELKEHEFLILAYQDLENKFHHILIDPTYKQFCKKKDLILLSTLKLGQEKY